MYVHESFPPRRRGPSLDVVLVVVIVLLVIGLAVIVWRDW